MPVTSLIALTLHPDRPITLAIRDDDKTNFFGFFVGTNFQSEFCCCGCCCCCSLFSVLVGRFDFFCCVGSFDFFSSFVVLLVPVDMTDLSAATAGSSVGGFSSTGVGGAVDTSEVVFFFFSFFFFVDGVAGGVSFGVAAAGGGGVTTSAVGATDGGAGSNSGVSGALGVVSFFFGVTFGKGVSSFSASFCSFF